MEKKTAISAPANMISCNETIEKVWKEVKKYRGMGKVASYIPELAKVDAGHFGMTLMFLNGETFHLKDYNIPFSIQSISKVFTTAMAFAEKGEELWKRVGVEPSGSAFNSLLQLEYENGIPRNPFINAGALVIIDILLSTYKNPVVEILNLIRTLTDDENININKKTALSEKRFGFRNAALANLLKDFGNIKNNVEDVLDVYFNICAIEMTTEQLAKAFLIFVNHGTYNKFRLLTVSQTKRLNAVMQTCGFYDEAGEFSFKVGLPGKSGVGGGIVAILPDQFSIAVWSPALNEKGNSIMGMKALEYFTTLSGKSIF